MISHDELDRLGDQLQAGIAQRTDLPQPTGRVEEGQRRPARTPTEHSTTLWLVSAAAVLAILIGTGVVMTRDDSVRSIDLEPAVSATTNTSDPSSTVSTPTTSWSPTDRRAEALRAVGADGSARITEALGTLPVVGDIDGCTDVTTAVYRCEMRLLEQHERIVALAELEGDHLGLLCLSEPSTFTKAGVQVASNTWTCELLGWADGSEPLDPAFLKDMLRATGSSAPASDITVFSVPE